MSLLTDLMREKKYGALLNTVTKKAFGSNHATRKYREVPSYFVLSTGRVGTQTLSAILSKSTQVLSFHEPTPRLYEISEKAYRFDNQAVTTVLETAFLLLRKDHLKASLINKKIYVETAPQCTFIAPAIKRALPNAKFIHLVRNPESVIKSGMTRAWYAGHPYDESRIIPSKKTSFSEKWNRFTALEKNIWLWTETNNWIYNYLSELEDREKLLMHSEDIFENKENTIQSLFEFLEVQQIERQVIQEILSKKLNNNKGRKVRELDLTGVDDELLTYYNQVKANMDY